jgi:hypothetical protein
MRRRGAALAAAAGLLIFAAGCETTQQESAKIGRHLGHQSAVAGTTRLGAVNHDVRVDREVLLSAGGQSAVAVELTNTSATAQVAFPILIDVLDAKGRSLYRNDTAGLEPSLQTLALLPAHATAWWVDNEVLASAPKSVSAQVGASTATAPADIPRISTSGASASASFPGPHVTVTVSNRSTVAQSQLAVYTVISNGSAVVGVGRGVVPALAAGASTQVVVSVVGSIAGHTIALTASPSQLR